MIPQTYPMDPCYPERTFSRNDACPQAVYPPPPR